MPQRFVKHMLAHSNLYLRKRRLDVMLTQLMRLKDWPFLSVVVLLLLLVVTHATFRWIEGRARRRKDAPGRVADVNREAAGSRPVTDRKS